MKELNYYFIALMIFIFGLGVIVVANDQSKTTESSPASIGKYVAGGLILGTVIMIMLVIFLGLILLLKWLWIGLVG